jgi:hypothetical protein
MALAFGAAQPFLNLPYPPPLIAESFFTYAGRIVKVKAAFEVIPGSSQHCHHTAVA